MINELERIKLLEKFREERRKRSKIGLNKLLNGLEDISRMLIGMCSLVCAAVVFILSSIGLAFILIIKDIHRGLIPLLIILFIIIVYAWHDSSIHYFYKRKKK